VSTEPPCENWLAIVADDEAAAALQSAMRGSSTESRHFTAGTELVQCSTWHAPQAIVVDLGSCATANAVSAPDLPAGWDVPLLMVGSARDLPPAELEARLGGSGAHHWVPEGTATTPADWALALAFAQAAHRRDQAQRQRIASLQDQLAEQRVVARAKGLLMAAQGMTEDDAFAFLRSGAMQTRAPLADMARAVVDAAIWSEAVNRAGQLRWLSQRCIAAAAQRLARIDPPVARRMQNDALKRARDILDDLGRLPLPDSTRLALDETDSAWLALKSCLDERLELGSLSLADSAADRALAHAEVLTSLLQAVGSSPILRVVNLCGRQRMRAQRLVKLGLLHQLGVAAQAQGSPGGVAEAAALVAVFGNTLAELAALPLGSAEIVAAHQLAADRWAEMVAALQTGDLTALVRCGEALLISVDALTLCWERSLQLLLG
jgi:ANTAR domain